jgi:hypothetical protein
MKDYATIPNTSGAFPNVVSVDASSPGAVDGTPFFTQFIDDLWGARQHLLNRAGVTPSGATEQKNSSDAYEAQAKCFGHPGEIVAWTGVNSDPSALGIRLIPLVGQGLDLSLGYSDLLTAVYVGDPNNPTAVAYYRSSSPTGTPRSITGGYLILPDLRGYALRGLDLAAAVDPDGAGRELGDTQDYAVMRHHHPVVEKNLSTTLMQWGLVTSPFASGSFSATRVTNTGASDVLALSASGIAAKFAGINAVDGINTNEFENRMANSAVHWCIRY